MLFEVFDIKTYCHTIKSDVLSSGLACKEQSWKNKWFSWRLWNPHGCSIPCTYTLQSLMKSAIYLSSRRSVWYLWYLRQSGISIGGQTYWDGNLTPIRPNSLKRNENENVKTLWESLFHCFIRILFSYIDFFKNNKH